jgi:uncharacterized RDD family membrane protein YckC
MNRGSEDWGRRMGGALVDLAVAAGVFLVTAWVGAVLIAIGGTGPIIAAILLIVAGIAGAILYAPLLMVRRGEHNGQTFGKQAIDMRVVRRDGEPIGFGVAMVREVVFKLLFGVAITGGLFLIVDALWPLFERDGLAVHDIATDTRAVDVVASPPTGGE